LGPMTSPDKGWNSKVSSNDHPNGSGEEYHPTHNDKRSSGTE